METAFTVGEEELCCLVAADHHERRQTNKRLSEFYDELFALYGGKLCKKNICVNGTKLNWLSIRGLPLSNLKYFLISLKT